jgi:predicted amidohydrolase
MSEPTIRLAVLQLRTETDYALTMEKAHRMLAEAATHGTDIAVLPEMFFCPYAAGAFPRYAETAEGPAAAAMADWAVRFGVTVVGGSLPERDGERLYNTCFVFGPDGRRLARYRKAHLFDVDLADGTSFRESDTFSPGDEICVFDAAGCRIGLAICFDLRFPELIRAMAVRGAELILAPSQFTMRTGALHWEKILTMRALDNDVFVAGVCTARNPQSGYTCWGHSLLVSPFGTVLADRGTEEGLRIVEIDLDEVAAVRRQLPTFLHLRRDLYRVAE